MNLALFGLLSVALLDLPTDDVARLLRTMPGVARVDVRVKTPMPKQRLIHFRDCHYESTDRFKKRAEQVGKRPTKKELDAWYNVHFRLVEAVQEEQEAVLRQMVKLGLQTVCPETVSRDNIQAYRDDLWRIKEAKQAPRAWLPPDLRALLVYRGAAARLAAAELVDIMPLEERAAAEWFSKSYEQTLSVTSDRRDYREDAMVHQVRAAGSKNVVVILGAGHDLTGAVRRANEGLKFDMDYIAVTTRCVDEFRAQFKNQVGQ
jgi:hypothetical protein